MVEQKKSRGGMEGQAREGEQDLEHGAMVGLEHGAMAENGAEGYLGHEAVADCGSMEDMGHGSDPEEHGAMAEPAE